MIVYVLLSAAGMLLSVYAERADAEAKAARFNGDPMLDAETPDPDAPYRVESWAVLP